MKRQLLLKDHVPFWRVEVEGLVVWPIGSDVGYAMSGDHAHQHYEIMFNYAPIPIRHSVGGNIHETSGQCILWRAPYVLHSLRTLSDAPYVRQQISFPPFVLAECCQFGDLSRLRTLRSCIIPADEEQMARLAELLRHMQYLWDRNADEKMRYGLLASLLFEIQTMLPDDVRAGSPVDSYVQEIMIHIVEHAEEDLTLESLSRLFYVSKTKLEDDFQAVTQQTVHEYVSAIRMYRAKILLGQDLPLSVIAGQCGYSRDSAFIRMFRRETGMTPGEYRASLNRE